MALVNSTQGPSQALLLEGTPPPTAAILVQPPSAVTVVQGRPSDGIILQGASPPTGTTLVQGRPPQALLVPSIPASSGATLEATEEEEGPISTWNYWMCVYNSVMHLLGLVFMVKTGLFPVFDSDDVDDGTVHGNTVGLQNFVRVLTLIFGPIVIVETAIHWSRGTFFPMTSADSFYVARFQKNIDTTPKRIYYGTIWAMMCMAIFYTICSSINLSIAVSAYANMDTLKTGTLTAWQVRVNLVMQLVSVIGLVKRYVLVCVFLFFFSNFLVILGTITCGYGWVLLCVFCVKGFDSESRICGVSLQPFHKFIAFFYRNL